MSRYSAEALRHMARTVCHAQQHDPARYAALIGQLVRRTSMDKWQVQSAILSYL